MTAPDRHPGCDIAWARMAAAVAVFCAAAHFGPVAHAQQPRSEAATGGEVPDDASGGPDAWRIDTEGGALNLRTEPFGAAPVYLRLPDGAVLRNRGCRMSDGARWCRVATLDGSVEAWAAGAFLREATVPAEGQPLALSGEPGMTEQRVDFGPGGSRALMVGTLDPGAVRDYVVGVAAGQTLSVRLPRRGDGVAFAVFAPDGAPLFESRPGGPDAFVGRIAAAGEAVVAVRNDAGVAAGFDIDIALE